MAVKVPFPTPADVVCCPFASIILSRLPSSNVVKKSAIGHMTRSSESIRHAFNERLLVIAENATSLFDILSSFSFIAVYDY